MLFLVDNTQGLEFIFFIALQAITSLKWFFIFEGHQDNHRSYVNFEVSRLKIFSDFILECQITGSWNRNSFKCHKMSSCNSPQAFNALNLKGTVYVSQFTVDLNEAGTTTPKGFSCLNGLQLFPLKLQINFLSKIMVKSRGWETFPVKDHYDHKILPFVK